MCFSIGSFGFLALSLEESNMGSRLYSAAAYISCMRLEWWRRSGRKNGKEFQEFIVAS